MLKTKQEKLLAAVLVGTLVVAASRGLVNRFVLSPLAAKRTSVKQAEETLRQAQLELEQVQVARRVLDTVTSQCLQVGDSRATVVYQERLMALCELAGLQESLVTPLQSVPLEPIGRRLVFTVQAAAGSIEVARLVGLLERDAIANNVTLLSIDRIDEASQRLTLNVEVLAVEGRAAAEPIEQPSASAVPTLLQQALAENDPFVRGYNGASRPETTMQVVREEPPKPKPDPRTFLRLVGLVEYRGQTLAWMVDSRSGEASQYRPNDTIRVEDWAARVIDVQGDALTVEVDGEHRTWKLGTTLLQNDS
jgi:hypothetical protein